MTYTHRPGPAVREQTSLLIGLAGPSSSGKTFSALRLATGMANGGPITVIDTEGRRALHYADQFKFEHGELTAPFRPEAYMEALEEAKAVGSKVIIVDSQSHEHEGPGGCLEWHDEELERLAGNDWAKRERVKFTAWIKIKRAHNRFVNSVLQLGVHVIFCFRAKPKLALIKNDKGKIEPVDMGWQPICSDRFQYEMTTLLMLPPNGQGVPDLSAPATKLQEQHKPFMKDGEQISENMGKQFAEWAAGGAAREPAQQHANGANGQQDAIEMAKEMAAQGKETFTAWWQSDGKKHRAALKPHIKMLQQIAKNADDDLKDERMTAEDDPFDATSNGDWMTAFVDDKIAAMQKADTEEGIETIWIMNNERQNQLTEEPHYQRLNDAYEARMQELRG